MDKVAGSIQAKRDNKGKVAKAVGSDVKEEVKKETKIVDIKGGEVSGAKSIEGKASKD